MNIIQLRADRFNRVEVTGEIFQRPQGFESGEHLSIRWGISVDAEADVSVRFQNTGRHRTALDKLRGDVSRRQLYCRDCRLVDESPDGPSLLRDRMSGMSEIAAWIRSYGDAAEVLEPLSLRRQMARTAKLMLGRYHAGGEVRE